MESLKMLLTDLVRPHLESGNGVWAPRYQPKRKATKVVPGLEELDYSDRLKCMVASQGNARGA